MAFTIAQLQDFSNTKPELRYVTEKIIDYLEANPPGDGGDGGSSYLLKQTVTLTDAQIKALPTTPIQVVAAPGAGKFISLIQGIIILDNSNGAYSNIAGGASTVLYFGVGETNALQTASNLYVESDMGDMESTDIFPLIFSAPANIGTGIFAAAGPSDADTVNNKPMFFAAGNGVSGNFTGGNAANTLKVTVYYLVIDL